MQPYMLTPMLGPPRPMVDWKGLYLNRMPTKFHLDWIGEAMFLGPQPIHISLFYIVCTRTYNNHQFCSDLISLLMEVATYSMV